ncbi:MAG: response regulator [Lachnospiraceae bacterium]|nr:response regulator [Lachnospiraceae bacterium]
MLKVLVVEDEELIRKGIVLATDWASIGCVVAAEAGNGEEGLRLALELKPDIIIADIRMPKMDGLEMLKALRENGSEASVIILTSYSSFEYARTALRLGAVDFLLKPYHDGELEAAIGRLREEIDERKKASAARIEPSSSAGPSASRKGAGSGPADPAQETGSLVNKSRNTKMAIDYIEAHYADPNISVGSIANALEISEGHLSHVFKRETGMTILGYLTRQRIHAAQDLLINSNYKVYEVCEKVGYRDITYFSATFKKVTGLSPTEFQNRM